jgi:hypothetical protein
MNAKMVAFAARIRTELVELEQVVQRAEYLLGKAHNMNDPDYLDGVALSLHGFYTGVEHLFEEIAREIDGSLPGGSEWHRNLLIQMSAEMVSVRPPVIQAKSRVCLDEYRGFRHVVRNIYAFHLRPSRLEELAKDLRVCYVDLTGDILAFCAFLEQLTDTSTP